MFCTTDKENRPGHGRCRKGETSLMRSLQLNRSTKYLDHRKNYRLDICDKFIKRLNIKRMQKPIALEESTR